MLPPLFVLAQGWREVGALVAYRRTSWVDCEVWKLDAVMNMMYSDYCKAARKNSVDKPEFYADLAAAFLEDKDAPEDKAGRYYHNIAVVQE